MEKAAAMTDNMIIKAKSKLPLDLLVDEMKDVLSKTWSIQSRNAIIEAIRLLGAMSGAVSWEEYDFIEKTLSKYLGKSYTELVSQPLFSVHSAAWTAGAATAVGGAVDFMWNLPDMKSLEVLKNNTFFWVGEFYNDHIQKNVKETLKTFYSGGYTRDEVMQDLKQSLGKNFKKPAGFNGTTDEYWDFLADHTCTKIREVGRVSGYEQAGITEVEFRAHLDKRTTEICRNMHGRIIKVSAMRSQVDNYLKACESKDKEKIKASWPWISNKQAKKWKDKSTKSMGKKGVTLPPLHPSCRSITVAYFGETPSTLDYGDGMSRQDKKFVNAWTPEEHRNFTDGIKANSGNLEWRDKDLKDDILKQYFAKHAKKEFGIKNLEDYIKNSRDIINNADSIFVRNFKGETQYFFACSAKKGYAVVDRSGVIRGCYGHKKKGGFEKWLKNHPGKYLAEIQ